MSEEVGPPQFEVTASVRAGQVLRARVMPRSKYFCFSVSGLVVVVVVVGGCCCCWVVGVGVVVDVEEAILCCSCPVDGGRCLGCRILFGI